MANLFEVMFGWLNIDTTTIATSHWCFGHCVISWLDILIGIEIRGNFRKYKFRHDDDPCYFFVKPSSVLTLTYYKNTPVIINKT